ncbi:carboxylesterase/lipase family protein [Streptomyces actinomycinicus]|uniref:Carboxylic ester hydrolase n=1 Tax=Streptomyces actinomycinicus TaxID=1695166 RepID=A0A937JRZ5_9ACTN|nr:carboxylesterase/lipase family protein [Streptomyces actinomycinicus]MBL1086936.1 carboxylesterase/lipase family protein [Streptomyces actinomycinicus]
MRPVLATAHGLVRGTADPSGTASFKNIPYAAAPTGPLRFAPPHPPVPWDGIRDAGAYGPTAPQAPYAPPMDRLLPETLIPGEDFLNLNVWTPDPAGRLPVLVWLHGGAFTNGSGSLTGYDGTAFARDGVVLVTLNYRLGAEGFLHLGPGDTVRANLGLLDQIAALEWVRDNITSFGGDPDRVTVAGQSAGAMSIGALLAMPAAKGLFRRAALQSGAAHHTLSAASAVLVAARLAAILGVPPTRPDLAAVPVERLLAAQSRLRGEIAARPDPALWGEAAFNLMPFEPVVDHDTLPRAPMDAIAEGGAAGVDVLAGWTSDEFRLFTAPSGLDGLVTGDLLERTATGYGLPPGRGVAAYRAAFPGASRGELFAQLATDWFYRVPALRLAEAQAAHGARTFVYEFAWPSPAFDGALGACHALDVPFVFGNLADPAFAPLLGDAPPPALAETMHAAWVSFATTGDPGWPAYRAPGRAVRYFADVPITAPDPRTGLRTLWDGLR